VPLCRDVVDIRVHPHIVTTPSVSTTNLTQALLSCFSSLTRCRRRRHRRTPPFSTDVLNPTSPSRMCSRDNCGSIFASSWPLLFVGGLLFRPSLLTLLPAVSHLRSCSCSSSRTDSLNHVYCRRHFQRKRQGRSNCHTTQLPILFENIVSLCAPAGIHTHSLSLYLSLYLSHAHALPTVPVGWPVSSTMQWFMSHSLFRCLSLPGRPGFLVAVAQPAIAFLSLLVANLPPVLNTFERADVEYLWAS
jgi:hypothetical protein